MFVFVCVLLICGMTLDMLDGLHQGSLLPDGYDSNHTEQLTAWPVHLICILFVYVCVILHLTVCLKICFELFIICLPLTKLPCGDSNCCVSSTQLALTSPAPSPCLSNPTDPQARNHRSCIRLLRAACHPQHPPPAFPTNPTVRFSLFYLFMLS